MSGYSMAELAPTWFAQFSTTSINIYTPPTFNAMNQIITPGHNSNAWAQGLDDQSTYPALF